MKSELQISKISSKFNFWNFMKHERHDTPPHDLKWILQIQRSYKVEEEAVETTIERLVIWHTMMLMWCHSYSNWECMSRWNTISAWNIYSEPPSTNVFTQWPLREVILPVYFSNLLCKLISLAPPVKWVLAECHVVRTPSTMHITIFKWILEV